MPEVKARPGEGIDSLLRRFKKVVEQSGILSDYRKSERYEKPSVKRKKKQAAARKRAAKRFVKEKPKNCNFKFNKDKTQKIPMAPNPQHKQKTYNRNQK